MTMRTWGLWAMWKWPGGTLSPKGSSTHKTLTPVSAIQPQLPDESCFTILKDCFLFSVFWIVTFGKGNAKGGGVVSLFTIRPPKTSIPTCWDICQPLLICSGQTLPPRWFRCPLLFPTFDNEIWHKTWWDRIRILMPTTFLSIYCKVMIQRSISRWWFTPELTIQ